LSDQRNWHCANSMGNLDATSIVYCCRIPKCTAVGLQRTITTDFWPIVSGVSDTLKLVECSNHTRQKYREAVVAWGKIPRCCGQKDSFASFVQLLRSRDSQILDI